MMRTKLFATLSCSLLWASSAFAGGPNCAPDCAPGCAADYAPRYECQFQNVERTIYVPQVTMETRKVMVTQCRPETRERTFTVYKQVADTKMVTQQRTVQVPQQQTRTETYYVPRPIYKDVVQTYTVMVPHQETVTLSRTVCKPYPVKMQRTVSVDQGHWEERVVAAQPVQSGCADNCASASGCGNCGSCGNGDGWSNCAPSVACDQPVTQKVWVPNLVQKVEYRTFMKYKTEEVPYESTRTVCRPEERSQTVRQYAGCEQEARTREVTYTVCVPQVQTRQVPVTTYTAVPSEQKQTYTVMVPYTVEKEVQVPVCRMVAKTIVCKVPVWAPCNSCDSRN